MTALFLFLVLGLLAFFAWWVIAAATASGMSDSY